MCIDKHYFHSLCSCPTIEVAYCNAHPSSPPNGTHFVCTQVPMENAPHRCVNYTVVEKTIDNYCSEECEERLKGDAYFGSPRGKPSPKKPVEKKKPATTKGVGTKKRFIARKLKVGSIAYNPSVTMPQTNTRRMFLGQRNRLAGEYKGSAGKETKGGPQKEAQKGIGTAHRKMLDGQNKVCRIPKRGKRKFHPPPQGEKKNTKLAIPCSGNGSPGMVLGDQGSGAKA
ncbi:hypothetical protein BJ878DRAFT_476655 [Calycina marina]|uniref:Uncharacterized protein n=1 Tax=Calycina marina TaxID=1763456 RepID=A0A9P8CK52_9HELO|nr:hypothetical protein BJ878DRAFT_476655 [Calycina marina]